ncbi:MAG: septal ring lytic transglycosylase RlpA family lipoprotein [Deltaproteobacteria bacterium]|nr:MAG: septal ring lytic transglycosylase RlpA family lipoprotein [Deltaproteobacteria bacterium]
MLSLRLVLALTFALIVVAGCTPKVLHPPNIPARHAEKGTPSSAQATQRPYRIRGVTYYPIPSARGYHETGVASWYGKKFHGRSTANGETYDMYAMTAAHKTLPMNTVLLVKNLDNDRSVIVRVNDRGPFVKSRIIDLTYTAAKKLGMAGRGTARVSITAMQEEPVTVAAEVPPQQGSTVVHRQQPSRPTVPAQQPDFDKGNFYIQVGAFKQITNARRLANQFADKGRDVVIQQYPAAGMNLYRVMVYSGTSLAAARRDEKRLEQQGYPYALVINR